MMPKPQQQQQSLDLELDHLVRQSPIHISRTPSPSSPGSVLDLPNVPFYPRLPPISPSHTFSGLSNPTFNAEDEATSARPSGDQVVILLVVLCQIPKCNCVIVHFLDIHCIYIMFIHRIKIFFSLLFMNLT